MRLVRCALQFCVQELVSFSTPTPSYGLKHLLLPQNERHMVVGVSGSVHRLQRCTLRPEQPAILDPCILKVLRLRVHLRGVVTSRP